MTLRGVIKGGSVKLTRKSGLPDGTVVDIRLTPVEGKNGTSTAASSATKRKPKKGAKPLTKEQRQRALRALFGIWKDRPEWEGKSSVEIARELRQKALGGRFV